MKDYKDKLSLAIKTALDGEVSYGGNEIPIYRTAAPKDAGDYYVLVASIGGIEDGTKDRFIHRVDIQVEVLTYFASTVVTDTIADNIAGQVLNTLIPTKGSTLSLTGGFTMVTCTPVSQYDFNEVTDTGRLVRKLINLKSIIQEN